MTNLMEHVKNALEELMLQMHLLNANSARLERPVDCIQKIIATVVWLGLMQGLARRTAQTAQLEQQQFVEL